MIIFLWKTGPSGTGNCPALYAVTEGADVVETPSDTAAGRGYIVQVKKIKPEAMAQLRDLGTDETAGFVPADVIERVRELV